MNTQDSYTCEICSASDNIICKNLTNRLIEKNITPQFKVVKCKHCGLHSLYPIPSDTDLEWIYTNYSLKGDRLRVEKLRIEKIYPAKIKKIQKYHPNPKILDIGAGLGGFSFAAKANGLETIGIELEPEQVQLAKKEFNVKLSNISVEDFLVSNNQTFDVIHMHHVLEHLQHPKDILRKIRKILSPEGIIIFEVPNQFFVFTREVKIMLKVKKSEKPYNPYHHIYFFSPYTLKNLIEAGGYNIYELNQIPSIVTNSLKVRVYKSLANLFRMGYTNNIEAVIGAKKY